MTWYSTESFQYRKTFLLIHSHVVYVVKIGIKSNLPGLECKEYGYGKEGAEDGPASFPGWIEMPVDIQFEGVPGALCLRNEYRQEEKDKDYGPKKHHCPYETKVPQGRSLQKKKAQECADCSNISRKEGFHLLCQGFPLVRLIL